MRFKHVKGMPEVMRMGRYLVTLATAEILQENERVIAAKAAKRRITMRRRTVR